MARKLYVTDEMGLDDALTDIAQCDLSAALMWPWVIPYLDDWGRGEANPRRIKGKIFPNFSAVSFETVEVMLQLFAQQGLINLYEVAGKRYMAVEHEKWFRFQTHIHASKRTNDGSRYPAPPSNTQNLETQATREVAEVSETPRYCAELRDIPRYCAETRASPSPSPSPSPSLSPSPSPSLTEEEDQTRALPLSEPLPKKATPPADKNKQSQIIAFLEFYAIYPVKRARQDAEKAWLKISPNAVLRETIMTGLANAKNSEEWQEDSGKYIPHPATFLNHCRWEDDYTPVGSRTPAVRSANGSNHPNTLQGVIDDTARAVRAEQSRQEALRQPLQPKGLFQ